MLSISIPEQERDRIKELDLAARLGMAAQKQLDGILDMVLLRAGVRLEEKDQVKITDTDILILRSPALVSGDDSELSAMMQMEAVDGTGGHIDV